jgi:hypothetical protein
MATRITGRVEVLLNGQLLLNKAGATAIGIGISGLPPMELEAVTGDSGVHGHIEKPIIPACEVTISDRDDISLSDIASVRDDGTVIFRAAGGGKSYTLANASSTRNFTITAGEGETPLRFEGLYWTESTQ